jgi:hypothetical protein
VLLHWNLTHDVIKQWLSYCQILWSHPTSLYCALAPFAVLCICDCISRFFYPFSPLPYLSNPISNFSNSALVWRKTNYWVDSIQTRMQIIRTIISVWSLNLRCKKLGLESVWCAHCTGTNILTLKQRRSLREGDWEVVKRSGRGESIRVVTHICMEAMLGISV